ncbi:MAG: DNA translocase FtsK [Eggerthellaceae bacterium]
MATQRPSTNVVTGLIKANITNRIAFNVASGIDSRVVLTRRAPRTYPAWAICCRPSLEYAKPQRIQGCYVSEDEINAVVDMLKQQGSPSTIPRSSRRTSSRSALRSPTAAEDRRRRTTARLEAAEIVVSSGLGSTSNIQRRLQGGYSRAGRIMDMLEEKGVVGPPNGSKPREVLVDAMELETLKAFEAQDAADAEG